MKLDFVEELDGRAFILDGAMGTNIQALHLNDGDYGGKPGCNEYLNLTRPDTVRSIHKSFLDVGCMGVETNTMGGSRLKLAEYGLADKVEAINAAGAELAREVIASSGRKAYVFGSMGPTGFLPSSNDPDLGRITFDELAAVFEEQAAALIKGGVDVLLIETSQDILEVKAAVLGCKKAISASDNRIPVITQVSLDASGRMLMGTDIGAVLVTLEGMGVDGIGINCSTGPDGMKDSARFLCEHSPLPVSVLPNMGMPQNIDGVPTYPLDPVTFAVEMEEFVRDLGVDIVGGCCGSTPSHLSALVRKLNHVELRSRKPAPLRAISSAMTYVTLKQEPPPLLVGERVNSQGSRKMKQFLLDDDLDGIAALARDQSEKGAHAIDVCVALNELDGEKERFVRVVKELALRVSSPVMIDSTDSEVIIEGIKNYPGRVIVNSINLESGESKIKELGGTIRDFGSFVIALTIDEQGMAATSSRKVAIAERIASILKEKYDIPPERIIFDPLTFTLATGEKAYLGSAVETLNAVTDIKKSIPRSLTILGVSNISFGLSKPARSVLNSVFLYHAIRKGLDLAIVNPADIKPYSEIPIEERELAEDLIFNRKSDALGNLISHFEGISKKKTPSKKTRFKSPGEEIHHNILNRKPEGIEKLLDKLLHDKDAVTILNTVLLPAMKEVGDRFGSGELILPFVLQSAEVMKLAVKHLENFMEKKEGYSKGKVLLATVYGDVHDIGKNLVKTILSNNGYEVKDLGKQVPVQRIVEEAKEFDADAVGLSALLVSTSKQMPIVARELHKAGLDKPVLIGGAAVTRRFARSSARLEDGLVYPGGLFYAKDAFEGLQIIDALTDPEGSARLMRNYFEEAGEPESRPGPGKKAGGRGVSRQVPSIQPVTPPTPPFWGLRQIDDIDLDEVYKCLDLKSLYRLSWGIRHMKPDEFEEIIRTKFEPLRLKLQEEAKSRKILEPRVVYGYFPCKGAGTDLFIYDPNNRNKLAARMHFPRQEGKKSLSIADYFRDDVFDVVALQLATVGRRAGEICTELNEKGDYSRSYFLHGLSVETAEALAEYLHRLIKRELNLEKNRGKRYSHGYPACPDLKDNLTILELLEAEKRLGVTLTSAFQFVPEQTTAAVVVHHPEAEYFSV